MNILDKFSGTMMETKMLFIYGNSFIKKVEFRFLIHKREVDKFVIICHGEEVVLDFYKSL